MSAVLLLNLNEKQNVDIFLKKKDLLFQNNVFKVLMAEVLLVEVCPRYMNTVESRLQIFYSCYYQLVHIMNTNEYAT